MKGNIDHQSHTIISVVCLLIAAIQAEDSDYGGCEAPLGMESGRISDEALSASSIHHLMTGPQYGRLNNESAGGAWCPGRNSDTTQSKEWLQVDLGQVYKITAVATQGRFDKGIGAEFSREISLEYYSPASKQWEVYLSKTDSSRLPSNDDTYTPIKTYLDHPIYTNSLRILPHSNDITVCLRAELYGCLPQKEEYEKYMPQIEWCTKICIYGLIASLVIVTCVACVSSYFSLRYYFLRKTVKTLKKNPPELASICAGCASAIRGNNNAGYNDTSKSNKAETNSEGNNLLRNERRRHDR